MPLLGVDHQIIATADHLEEICLLVIPEQMIDDRTKREARRVAPLSQHGDISVGEFSFQGEDGGNQQHRVPDAAGADQQDAFDGAGRPRTRSRKAGGNQASHGAVEPFKKPYLRHEDPPFRCDAASESGGPPGESR